MYDLIGDIHGHASELVKLLAALGYSKHKGVYKHPERQAIFLGDFIDRGPPINWGELVLNSIESTPIVGLCRTGRLQWQYPRRLRRGACLTIDATRRRERGRQVVWLSCSGCRRG